MTLKDRLRSGLLVLPGAVNALGARIVEDCGFEAVYLTGAGIANSFLGVPDIGLLSVTELAQHVAATRGAVSIPIVVDGDTGFGNAVNMYHTVRLLEAAGANAIQIEDQTFPKRCGHFDGKDVISTGEMVEKVRAAVDARRSDDFLIIARTDSRAILGLDEACDRANAFAEAGADVVFVEAPQSRDEIALVAARVPAPKVLNLVHGGVTPLLPSDDIAQMGYSIALFANAGLLGSITGIRRVLQSLKEGDPTGGIDDPAAAWADRQRLVRREEFANLERKYVTCVTA
jgi:2-methylisocitrate lyase-like PEP mutase family enzyme